MIIQKMFLSILVMVIASAWLVTGCSTSETRSPTDSGNENQSPPMPPYDLKAIAISPTEIKLTWRDQSQNESGFEIFESVNNDTSYMLVETVGQNVEIIVLTGRSRDNDYYYKIRAVNEFGASSFSNETEVTGGALILEIDAGEGAVLGVAYSPQGNYIIAGCSDYRVRRYNAYTGDLLQTLEVHSGHVNAVAYSPDSLRFASASDDGTIKVWHTWDQHIEWIFQEEGMGVDEVEFSPDGRYLASGGINVCIWDIEDGGLVNKFGYDDDTGGITSFAYHPNGRYMFCAARAGIELWNLDGPDTAIVHQRTAQAKSLKISADGRYMCGAYGSTVRLWEIVGEGDSMRLDSLTTLAEEEQGGHTDAVFAVDFSPDGMFIASGSRDNTAKVWDAFGYTLLGTLYEHDPAVYCLDFSPDGTHLATGGGDTKIKIWSTFF